MNIIERLYDRARERSGKILFPEALMDERVMEACKQLIEKNICEIVVLGGREQFPVEFKSNPLVTIINPKIYPRKKEMVKLFMLKRKKKKIDHDTALNMLEDPRYFATMLVEMREADAMVIGAYYTSADALRPALQIIKGKDNERVTGAMLMYRQDFNFPQLFLDISLKENPNAEELAQIGIAGAKFYENTFHKTAKVAFLSYSTFGSADGEMVMKVRNATNIAKERSNFTIEGELQYDAATIPEVAKTKCPSSYIKGKANVLVFPDLNSGNIGYKIAQRLGGCQAIGPIMLNFKYPVNDLSRGCSVQDIFDTAVITKLQIEGENV